MAKKPVKRLRPDSPNDTPRHEATEGPRERMREYGTTKPRKATKRR
jgi:hypothetical protein